MSEVVTPSPEILINEHLKLRAVREDEASDVFAVVDRNREYLGKWLPWVDSTKSEADSLSFIKDCQSKRESGRENQFGIYLDGVYVGNAGTMYRTEEDMQGAVPEIGYWIDEAYSGRGLATSATKALQAYCFEQLGVKKACIKADPDNIGSNRVIAKCGFSLVRTEKDEKGKLHNHYEIGKEDWNEQNRTS